MHRSVRPFDSQEAALADARERGACIVFDCHYRFWSVPSELTILECHSQMFKVVCDDEDLEPLADPPTLTPPSTFGLKRRIA